MTLDKRIAEQIARVEELQKDLLGRDVEAEDAKRPEAMKKERAAHLREAISGLERQKKEAIARYDAEIEARSAELKALDRNSDLDLALKRGGGPAPKRPDRKTDPKVTTRIRARKK